MQYIMRQRYILHIDMDAFYASVEQMDNPSLKGKPLIVGGTVQQRGVVAAASYEARKFGIHSAMPTTQALKLCPNVILLPVRMERYAEISGHIINIFHDFTPDVEQLSLDEAFLDVTGSIALFGSAEKIGYNIKNRIKNETGLTASVGIAPNKFLAKLASDLRKPDGFVIITEEKKQQTLDPLSISKIWGVGKVTAAALNKIGIYTIEQLRKTHLKTLQTVMGNQAEDLLLLSQGIDDRPVEPDREAKRMSAEETFAKDVSDKIFLLDILFRQVEEVAARLRADNVEGKTITLKLRYKNFKTVTRSHTFEYPTNISKVLWQEAKKVFEEWHAKSGGELRLLGFGVSGLTPQGSGQKLLFSPDTPEDKKQKKLDEVFDKIKKKYGDDSVQRKI
ncbi:MAG TPA: DNA polymerase IV [Phycisphaerales bacterium]|nr:DNA polymerase IV [Phycisphaerales bacterium]